MDVGKSLQHHFEAQKRCLLSMFLFLEASYVIWPPSANYHQILLHFILTHLINNNDGKSFTLVQLQPNWPKYIILTHLFNHNIPLYCIRKKRVWNLLTAFVNWNRILMLKYCRYR